jgi:hypothetical protein
MGVLSAVSVAEIKARGSIKDADVLKLRRSYYEDGLITAEEAETILALNDACPIQDPAWADCFVETITDFIVDQAEPEGYLTQENAEWLIRHVAKDGQIGSKTELELLLNVLDKARWVPQSLVRFALVQVRDAIIHNSGPLRAGKARGAPPPLPPPGVSAADVDLLRRILYSFGGDGNLAVTRVEAEVLFEIDAATAEADNHPSWSDLFVKAIANCVLGACGYAAPPRAVALARDAWLERRGELSIDEVLSGLTGPCRKLFGGYRQQTGEEQAIARLTQQKIEIITHEGITPAEVKWLAERIGRDGKPTANARSLLMFLEAESPTIDPILRDIAERAATAAA